MYYFMRNMSVERKAAGAESRKVEESELKALKARGKLHALEVCKLPFL